MATDSIPGISLDKAYQLLKGRKSVPVTVGVVDSGIDITHEPAQCDLENPKEKPTTTPQMSTAGSSWVPKTA